MNYRITLFVLFILLGNGVSSAQKAATNETNLPLFQAQHVEAIDDEKSAAVSQSVADFEIVELDIQRLNAHVKAGSQTQIQFRLQIGEKAPLRFDLELNDMRAPHYREIRTTDKGEIEIPRGPSHTYKGLVNQNSEQITRLTIQDHQIIGYFVDGKNNRFIEPLARFTGPGTPQNQFVVYNIDDVVPIPGGYCGVTEMEELAHQLDIKPSQQDLAKMDLDCPLLLEVATDADWEWFQMYGANSNAVILTNLNMVEGVYFTTFNLGFTIVFQNVWQTSADPYTAAGSPSSDILDEIRDEWNVNNATFMAVNRDLVHVFSAKNHGGLLGSVSGGLPAVCQVPDVSHGFTADRVGAFLTTAHEIGHNFNGVHGDGTNCGTASASIMCQGLMKGLFFSAASTTTIGDYIAANDGCLDNNLDPPTISCPGNMTLSTDLGECERDVTIPDPTVTDDCRAMPMLDFRYRANDGMGNTGSWTSYLTNTNVTLPLGRWEIEWRGSDGNGNEITCNFFYTIEDNEPPVAVCYNPTIEFNGEEEIFLIADDVWNEGASSDNCGTTNLVGFSPASVTCEDLGMIIPVTVTINDGNGNEDQCIANVTVAGLPCGWSFTPDGINCPAGNDVSYDPPTEVFTVTSEGCYDPNYYSNMDSHGYVGTELCGNGEIIAEVTSVTGNGFAGVSMREDLTAGSKMLQLSIDGTFLTKREMRMTTNGLAFNHLFQTQGKNWLRLERTGNQFTAQHSLDGINWSPVIIVNITMPNCIEIGLFTENNAPTGAVSATFDNVEVNEAMMALSGPVGTGIDVAESYDLSSTVIVSPNPTKGEAFVDIGGYLGRKASIRVFNSTGQALELIEIEEVEVPTQRLDLSAYRSGLYFVQVETPGQPLVTRKLMVVDVN